MSYAVALASSRGQTLTTTHRCFYLDSPSNAKKHGMSIKAKNEADIEKLTQIEQQIGAREEPLDGEFQGAQQAFAKEHNLSLYENEIQQEIDELGK